MPDSGWSMSDRQQVPKGPSYEFDAPPGSSAPGLAEAPASFREAPAGRPQRRIAPANKRPFRIDLEIPRRADQPGAFCDRRVKRALDLVLALSLLAMMAPLMLAIALTLCVAGERPLFIQRRVGRNRRRFAFLKFRTMHRDAEARLAGILAADPVARAEWQVHQKLTGDPRITRIGRILRRGSLDELPQLFNVLWGDMSLVGPRPVIAPEVDGYPADRAYYHSAAFEDYASCRPGITGLWQVAGRHRTSHADRVAIDGIYARNWSVTLDLRILWRTLSVVLAGSGR